MKRLLLVIVAILSISVTMLGSGCNNAGSNADKTIGSPQGNVDNSKQTTEDNPSQEAAKSKTVIVEISNFSFIPDKITVNKGTTVVWQNNDPVEHTIEGDKNEFQSGILAQGDKFETTFTDEEVINYHCGPHPSMKATIIIK